MEVQEIDAFDLFNFDFISVGIDMVGEKIRGNPMSESLGEDWNHMTLLPQ